MKNKNRVEIDQKRMKIEKARKEVISHMNTTANNKEAGSIKRQQQQQLRELKISLQETDDKIAEICTKIEENSKSAKYVKRVSLELQAEKWDKYILSGEIEYITKT